MKIPTKKTIALSRISVHFLMFHFIFPYKGENVSLDGDDYTDSIFVRENFASMTCMGIRPIVLTAAR